MSTFTKIVSKVADRNQGQAIGSFFNSYSTKV